MKRVYWFNRERFSPVVSKILSMEVISENNKFYVVKNTEHDYKTIVHKKHVFESKKSCLECYKGIINGIKADLDEQIKDAEDILLS